MVILLEIIERAMGYRGSKSVVMRLVLFILVSDYCKRATSRWFFGIVLNTVRCTLVAMKVVLSRIK